ncbi:flagellar hook-associated protein FlgL [Shewanella maritima]|uniref:flagellar hook-associated protein FlgL n=1 Tax=Shewanella maritima TaxID=2520507 RepID=UPI0037355EF6
MRISTGQVYQQNTTSILQKQSATNKILQQLASGKKVNTAGDDPVAAVGIGNLKQKNALVDQYMKNIDYAYKHQAVTEGKIGSAETLISSMREQLQRGANGSLAPNERQMIAEEMKQSLEELMSIANSQDADGNYIFAGTDSNIKPFDFDSNGNIVYSGNSNIREAIVASGVTLPTNVPGDAVFMNAPNPLGDYGVNYLASQQGDLFVNSAKIVDETAHIEGDYTFNFVDNAGVIDLQVIDPNGVTTTIPNFDPTNPVTVGGIEVSIEGTPVAGDSFTMQPQESVSILQSLNDAIAYLEDPQATETPQNASKLAQLLNNIDSGQNQVSTARGTAGNTLKSLESFTSNHEEEQVVNSSALSMLEDLDYAEAITEFEKQQLALNAVSSTFGKIGSLSLFNYI